MLGIEGKINAAGAVEHIRCDAGTPMELAIRGCGTLLVVFCRAATGISALPRTGPISVIVNGAKANNRVISSREELAAVPCDASTKGLRLAILGLGFSLVLVELPCTGAPEQLRKVAVDFAA